MESKFSKDTSENRRPGSRMIQGRCRIGRRTHPENAILQNRMSATIPAAVIAVMVLFIVAAIPVSAAMPAVSVSDYRVSPSVLVPGETGTITFTLTSTDPEARQSVSTGATAGSSFANTQSTAISVYLYNVHIEGNGIRVKTEDFSRVGSLGPGQSMTLTTLFEAPEKEGIYFPEIWIDTGTEYGTGTNTRYPVPVNVNTRVSLTKQPGLTLQKIMPQSIVPGDDALVTLTLSNTGQGRADDILLAINATVPSISLASPANYHVDTLLPGESEVFELRFGSDKNRALGIGAIPVQIRYADADGTKKELADTIGIPFRGKAALAVKSIASNPVPADPGKPFTLIIRIENTGTDRATSVRVALSTEMDGAKEVFIGSIDKNSDAPAVFHLTSARGGEIPAAITIAYMDDYGIHENTQETRVAVNPAGSPVLLFAIIATIVIAGGTYWYFRIRRRDNHG